MSHLDRGGSLARIEQWVSLLLANQSLTLPDGRPLYGYRATRGALEELAEDLRSVLAGPDDVVHCFKKLIGAAFCVYAAEWWRRNHSGGAWKWEGILATLDEPELGPGGHRYHLLQALVEQGLQFWAVELLETARGRGFLLTLACQGGLPLQLVREGQGQGRIRRYFRLLLHELDLPGHETVDPVRLARRVDQALPASLRQEVVFQLAGELAAAIRRFQGRLEELGRSSEDPIEILNQVEPEWQNRLPLRLDDEVAKALLRNLMADATEVSRQAAERFRWRRTLERRGNEWTLEGVVEVPTRLRAEVLFRIFGIADSVPPPTYVDLFMRTQEGATERVARGRRSGAGDESHYRLSPLGAASTPVRGEPATAGVEVYLGGGLRKEGTRGATVEGGAPLSELPWVFEGPAGAVESSPEAEGLGLEDGGYEFLGEGSVQTRKERVLLLVSPGTSVHGVDAHSHVHPVGTMARVDRALYLASGPVIVRTPDGEEHPIDTGAVDAAGRTEYLIDGQVSALDRGKIPLFSEMSVAAVSAGGGYRKVEASNLEWRPAHGAEWLPFRSRHFGEGTIRVREQGRVRAVRRVRLLPPGSSIRLELPQGEDPRGRIRLVGFGAYGRFRIDPLPEGAEVELESDASITVTLPPRKGVDSVDMTVHWEDQRLPLGLPYPAEWVAFSGPDGRRIEPGEQLPVNRLSGIRAVGFSLRQSPVLEARFRDPKVTESGISGGQSWARKLSAAPGSMDLYSMDLLDTGLTEWVRERLDASVSFDAEVTLTLQVPESPGHGRTMVTVGYFDLAFDPTEDGEALRLKRGHSGDPIDTNRADRLSVRALHLWGDDAQWGTEHELEREDLLGILPQWRLPESYRTTAEESLVFALEGSLHRAFPYLWRPGGDSRLLHEAHDRMIRELARDPLNGAWATRINPLIDRANEVPARAFPLLRSLQENPQAMALSALLLPSVRRDEAWQAMETLGFLWPAVPVQTWLEALDAVGPRVRSGELPPEEVLLSLELLLERLPGLRVPLLRWRSQNMEVGLPAALEELRRLDAIDAQVRTVSNMQIRIRKQLTGGLRWCPDPFRSQLPIRLEGEARAGGLAAGMRETRNLEDGTRHLVVNAPVMLALVSAEGLSLSPGEAFFMRIVRNHFPESFEVAHEAAMNVILARKWNREGYA